MIDKEAFMVLEYDDHHASIIWKEGVFQQMFTGKTYQEVRLKAIEYLKDNQ